MDEPFFIKLPLFEGPFDLLLFFIQRDELDIHDIPIAQITNDFLAYLSHLEELNIEVASEFMLTAATLMRIKAKLLLPRPEKDEEGNEIDPREALATALEEYRKYKSVITDFEALEAERMKKHTRGNLEDELKTIAKTYEVDTKLQHLDLYKLLKTYTRVMRQYAGRQEQEIHSIVPYPYSVVQRKDFILSELNQYDNLNFEDIIAHLPDKIAVIFTFLAILELIQVGKIEVETQPDFNQFRIRANPKNQSTENDSK